MPHGSPLRDAAVMLQDRDSLGHDDSDPAWAAVAQALQHIRHSSQACRIDFEVWDFAIARGAPDASRLTRETAAAITKWSVLFRDYSFRVHREQLPSTRGANTLVGTTNAFVTDGTTHWSLAIEPSVPASSIFFLQGRISNAPPRILENHRFLTWFSLGLGSVRIEPLDQQMRRGSARKSTDSGSTLECTLFLPESNNQRWTITARRQADSAIATLDALALDYYNDDGSLHFTESYSFSSLDDSWLSRTAIPSRCIVITHYPRGLTDAGADGESIWAAVVMVLTDVTAVEILPDTFSMHFPNNAAIYDERYRIGYRLGTTRINMDGRPFTTSAVLEGDVGDDLERYVRTGYFDDFTPTEPTRDQVPWAFVVAIGLAAVVVMIPHRITRRTPSTPLEAR